MSARDRVGAHVDLEGLVPQRHLEHCVVERDAFFHELETGLVEVAVSEKPALVLQIILQEQARLRFEERAMLDHQLRFRVANLRPVRHGRATRNRCGAHRGRSMRMHPYALAEVLGFAAAGENLLVGQSLAAALPDALGSKDLDHVSSVGNGLADVLPDLLHRHARVADRGDRRQQPGSR